MSLTGAYRDPSLNPYTVNDVAIPFPAGTFAAACMKANISGYGLSKGGTITLAVNGVLTGLVLQINADGVVESSSIDPVTVAADDLVSLNLNLKSGTGTVTISPLAIEFTLA